ncbi:MAG: primosomal protein N' [Verrucomicrobiae bacterium]|nr:primosomal protein N' [Verrucomicrobiae bacterium]
MEGAAVSLTTAPKGRIAVVRVDLRLNQEFDYFVPPSLASRVVEGARVRVPFGRRVLDGTVVALRPNGVASECVVLKPVYDVIGDTPVLSAPVLQLARWMSAYYLCPLDLCLRAAAPSVVRRRASMRKVKPRADPELDEAFAATLPSRPLPLTPAQAAALERVCAVARAKSPKPILLFGVTGSGKTEVYLQAIADVLRAGKGAIVLVPEISLTPQTVERFRARFALATPSHAPSSGARLETDADSAAATPPAEARKSETAHPLAVLHSGLSEGERFREWQRIRSGEARIVIGARSAVFAPVRDLGLLVVDEEHEATYKQEEMPRYHARDVAVMRGRLEGAAVVLGSATPSLESFHNARAGKYELCRLPERIDGRKLPRVRVVDMRVEILRQKGLSVFSQSLHDAILTRLERGEQIILYLNRRGYSASLLCRKCGYVAICPDCSVALAYHRADQILLCHFCGHRQPAPRLCPQPECRDPSIRFQGFGTEKLEEAVKTCFPQARVARMDSDTMTGRADYERTLLRFRMGRLDLLLGTQMIAKGLDFPRVTLVGIVYADLGLHLPDFRAGERTFQQITQVAGRAGRGDLEGEVIVQSFTPHHSAIQFGRRQDFVGFYEEETRFREQLDYPPFNHLTKIEFTSAQTSKAEFAAKKFREALERRIGSSVRLLGPSPAPIARLRGRHRFHLLLRDSRRKGRKEEIGEMLADWPRDGDVRVTVDVDPAQML